MGKKNKKGGGGLPGWFATYSDMMTLLFAFFVLLFSLSTLDPVKLAEFAEGDKKGESKDLGEIKKEFEKMIEDLNLDDKATVSQDPRGIALEIDGDICFKSGSEVLNDELKEILDRAVKDVLTEEGDLRPIIIEGHTDSDQLPETHPMYNKYPTNWELSTARASEVVKYLIENDVNFTRLSPSGYADTWPVGITWAQRRSGEVTRDLIDSMNGTRDLKQKNRRIKIIIGPNY